MTLLAVYDLAQNGQGNGNNRAVARGGAGVTRAPRAPKSHYARIKVENKTSSPRALKQWYLCSQVKHFLVLSYRDQSNGSSGLPDPKPSAKIFVPTPLVSKGLLRPWNRLWPLVPWLIILRGTNKLKLKPKPKPSEGMNVFFSRLARAFRAQTGYKFLTTWWSSILAPFYLHQLAFANFNSICLFAVFTDFQKNATFRSQCEIGL